LNIIYTENLRKIFAKGPKYREPQSINWIHNFKLLMDSMEDNAEKWIKREKEEVDTVTKWVKAIRSLIQIRIRKCQ